MGRLRRGQHEGSVGPPSRRKQLIDRDGFHTRLKALMEQHEMTNQDLAAEIWGCLRNAKDFDAEAFAERVTELLRQVTGDRATGIRIIKPN